MAGSGVDQNFVEYLLSVGLNPDNYSINKYDSAEVMVIYSTLITQAHPIFPNVLPPFQYNNDHYLLVEKLGTSLTKMRKQIALFDRPKVKNKHIFFRASDTYAKIIRDIFKSIGALLNTSIRGVLNSGNIYIMPGSRIEAQFTKFIIRGNNSYFEDCLDFKNMLADFNGKCGIRDVAKFEFDDFFSLLMNPTPSIQRHSMDVLEHPIFWPEQLRIAFIKALDDFLVANQAINTNIQAFDGGISMLSGNLAVNELLKIHQRYIVNNQIRSLYLQYLPNRFQNVPNSDMTRLCIETLKNLYTHFLTMKQPYIQLQNDEDLQHAVQEVFPMHLCILVPFARQINFPYQIGEILNYLYS